MAKRDQSAAPSAAEPDSFDLPLDEFCARLSTTEPRVELIGAFYADERRQGRLKASDAEWRQRFDAFAVRPVL